jgi:hypothetical protein
MGTQVLPDQDEATPLAGRFSDKLGVEPDDLGVFRARLQAPLHDALSEARAIWPDVHVSDECFADFLGHCVVHDAPFEQSINELRVGDLYLACAGMAGNPRSIQVLNTIVHDIAHTALAGIDCNEPVQDDIRQEFAERLFLGTSSTSPLLARYNGTAPLRSWDPIDDGSPGGAAEKKTGSGSAPG